MIAKHICVIDRFKQFFPKEEHLKTTYFRDYPGRDELQEGIDKCHYVVIELLPDDLKDKVVL